MALLAAGLAFFVASTLVVGVGGQRGPGFNPWIAFTIIPAGVSAVLGGVMAGYAVLRARGGCWWLYRCWWGCSWRGS